MSTPRSRLHALRKVLALERRRNYADAAVVGGLDRFLQRWAEGVSPAEPDDYEALQKLRDQGLLDQPYAAMTSRERAYWMGQVLAALGHTERPARGPTPPPRRPGAQRAAAPRQATSPRPPQQPPESLDSPITAVRGITTRTAALLRKMDVHTIHDLLYLFPHRHLDYSQVTKVRDLRVGEEQTLVAVIWEAREVLLGGRKGTEAVVGDDTGNLRVVWFNQPYLARSFRPNSDIMLSGRVEVFRGSLVMTNPDYEFVTPQRDRVHTGRLVPVYPLTEGLSQRTLRRVIKGVVDRWAPRLKDPLPPEMVRGMRLLPLPKAVRQLHYPDTLSTREQARRRLAFDEFFFMQLAVLTWRRQHRDQGHAPVIRPNRQAVDSFLHSLPFSLTQAQEHAIQEALRDMESTKAMARLLQGEVGSGKTVVALTALLAAATSGDQGAFLAPTEILAEQHFMTVERLLEGLAQPWHQGNRITVYLESYPQPITIGLLTGGMPKRRKEEMHRLLAEGAVDIIIGTHALLQGEVELPRLALVVIDEQHRFGVRQRATLRYKGTNPHLLVMSATPIPRSLALTLFGDLDLTVLDQMPSDRQPVKTVLIGPEKRDAAYRFVRKQVAEGHQGFVICPLIEESEAIQARAATEEYNRLAQEVFPDLRLGLLHGRMSLDEKQLAMESFRRGDLDILVATPVVEVGIDVPNATVILIEAANRFGMSQLHQLRGRVGRGQHQGYCVLLAEQLGDEARRRLEAVERLSDGFALAEEDLRIRGPGDYFGVRQSGLPQLKVASLGDRDILQLARDQAKALLQRDPTLRSAPLLRLELARYMSQETGDVS